LRPYEQDRIPYASGAIDTIDNEMKTLEIIVICFSLAGAIAISYVESSIIANAVSTKYRETSLLERYWHDLSRPQRWLFWTGLIFLMSPFIFLVL
jgi:hypothetical protein